MLDVVLAAIVRRFGTTHAAQLIEWLSDRVHLGKLPQRIARIICSDSAISLNQRVKCDSVDLQF